MQIRQLTAFLIRLPLKRPFKHASATRAESENILVCCELTDGTTGWGEGVPRSYVTGETPTGCMQQLAATPLAEQLSADCGTWTDVIALCQRFDPPAVEGDERGSGNNALRSAVETSILDAFGRLFGEPVSAVTAHFEPARELLSSQPLVRYSYVIDFSGRARRKAIAARLYGFRQCKVKVGRDGDDNVARLATIRRWCGSAIDLRIDANEAWHAEEMLDRLRPLDPFVLTSVEQPVPHAEVDALAELRKQITVPIMLDESLTSMRDTERAIEGGTCDLLNIRISKCGGFLGCLRIAARAREAGIAYQLGCHPGESGVLSAAGRHWATSVAGIRYWEGSYDRHIVRRLLTNEDLTFGYGGRAPALTAPGLGVTIDPAALDQAALAQQFFSIA